MEDKEKEIDFNDLDLIVDYLVFNILFKKTQTESELILKMTYKTHGKDTCYMVMSKVKERVDQYLQKLKKPKDS